MQRTTSLVVVHVAAGAEAPVRERFESVTLSDTATFTASDGPSLRTAIVYDVGEPGTTVGDAAVLVTLRSAACTTATEEPAALSSGSRSAVADDTDATLTSEETVEPDGIDTTTLIVTGVPTATVPSEHVTMPAAALHEPTLGVALTNKTPTGS